ncbi:MAG TPA: nicotinate phosphoribosyltransferase [Trueperaceae bacterium]
MTLSERRLAEGILFTDQYQLTMAQLYFRQGLHEKRVQFNHFFRHYPDYGTHKAGYCINAGLGWLLDWMQEVRFGDEEIACLRAQTGHNGAPLFDEDFLAWLRQNGSFDSLSMRAIPEGRVVHPGEPLTVIEGPLAMAQILETALLAQLNYQILIATKAARVRESGRGRPLLEFGVRRGHDVGANAGTRAALIGGADFSSNVGISEVLGIPPQGTHAHSMVQVFIALGMSELDAFRAYAETYPDGCMLLVDTVNTLDSGIPNAITVFEELRARGHEPVGIRLDSGDLAYLSIRAARMLDDAGFPDVSIVLSGELDELIIWQILTQIQHEAPSHGVDADKLVARLVYGVGTRLITSEGDSALGGVYKLVAVQDGGDWRPAIKLSDTPEKVPNPGHKRVWRVYNGRGMATADLIGLAGEEPSSGMPIELQHPADAAKHRRLRPGEVESFEPLLVDILDEGRRVYDLLGIDEMRRQREADIARLDSGVKRLVNPHIYHVSLTPKLWQLKQELIRSVSGNGM